MKSVLHSQLRRSDQHLPTHMLLAPVTWPQDTPFRRTVVDPVAHGDLLRAVQRFRGKNYSEDGAVHENQLTHDGRHVEAMDRSSWHLITQDDDGEILGCARYYPIRNPHYNLTAASKSALARSPQWRSKVRLAVENSITQAAVRGAQFAELGGWCVARSSRNTFQAFRSVLYMYALGELLGGTVGLSTATKRHSSSSILQRLGARKAGYDGEELPSYFEPMYDCEMDLLHFDSRRPAGRYAQHLEEHAIRMRSEMLVVCCEGAPATYSHSLLGLFNALSPVTGETRLLSREG